MSSPTKEGKYSNLKVEENQRLADRSLLSRPRPQNAQKDNNKKGSKTKPSKNSPNRNPLKKNDSNPNLTSNIKKNAQAQGGSQSHREKRGAKKLKNENLNSVIDSRFEARYRHLSVIVGTPSFIPKSINDVPSSNIQNNYY